PRRPPVLRSALRPRVDDRPLGAALAGPDPEGADPALVLTAALPDRPHGHAGPSELPRAAEDAVADRRGPAHREPHRPSWPDGRLPGRGGRVARGVPRPTR